MKDDNNVMVSIDWRSQWGGRAAGGAVLEQRAGKTGDGNQRSEIFSLGLAS